MLVMSDLMDALEAAGLTRAEARIYLFLLQHGASPQAAITKGAQLHRRTVYDVLARLAEKGVVSTITKNNRQFYEAARPERLMEMLREKEDALGNAMPKLAAMAGAQASKEEIKVFSGKAGLKTLFEDQIAEGKQVLIIGASPRAHKMLDYFFRAFDRKRTEKGIKVKLIFDVSAKGKFRRIPLSEIRYIPEELGGVATTNIYGDKVAIVLWNELTPYGILIQSKPAADSYRKLFEIVWEKAKRR
ncbi:MAG: helix-turn-helix domain-containing protein [Candidatus Aenigmatarchaeota archaeon]